MNYRILLSVLSALLCVSLIAPQTAQAKHHSSSSSRKKIQQKITKRGTNCRCCLYQKRSLSNQQLGHL